MEEIPEELKKFVPEIEDSDTDITKALYKVAFGLYPDEIEKLLRYYYFGFLLTNDDLDYYLHSKIVILIDVS